MAFERSDRLRFKDSILEKTAKAVKEVQALSFGVDGEQIAVQNEDRALQRLAENLDHIFLHGLRHVSPGYWAFVQHYTHKDIVDEVKALNRITTDLGRSRAWLYKAINDNSLESFVNCFLDDQSNVKKYYIDLALLRDRERLSLLLTLISGLDFVAFKLDLNIAFFDLVSHVPRSATERQSSLDNISLHSCDSGTPASPAVSVTTEDSSSFDRLELNRTFSSKSSRQSSIHDDMILVKVNELQRNQEEKDHFIRDGEEKKEVNGKGRIANGKINGEKIDTGLDHTKTSQMTQRPTSLPLRSVERTLSEGGRFVEVDGGANNNLHVVHLKEKKRKSKKKRKTSQKSTTSSTGRSRSSSIQSVSSVVTNDGVSEQDLENGTVQLVEKEKDSESDAVFSDNKQSRGTLSAADSKTEHPVPSRSLEISHQGTERLSPVGRDGPANGEECLHSGKENEDFTKLASDGNGYLQSAERNLVISEVCSHKSAISDESSVRSKDRSEEKMERGLTEAKSLISQEERAPGLSDTLQSGKEEKDRPKEKTSIETQPDLQNSTVFASNTVQRTSFDLQETEYVVLSQPSESFPYPSSLEVSEPSSHDQSLESHSYESLFSAASEVFAGVHELKSPGDGASETEETVSKQEQKKKTDQKSIPGVVKIDSNTKLHLMLEVFQHGDEKYVQLFQVSSCHNQGEVRPGLLLLSSLAVYLLRNSEKKKRYKAKKRIPLDQLDSITVSMDFQILFFIHKEGVALKTLALCTKEEELSRVILSHLKSACKESAIFPPSVVPDAKLHRQKLLKWAAVECRQSVESIQLYRYSLVHWDDAMYVNSDPDLSVYKQAVYKSGFLAYKTKESLFLGSFWQPGYFELKDRILTRYSEKGSKKAQWSLQLCPPDFTGCRRLRQRDRNHCFEIIQSKGPSYMLACDSERQLSSWLAAICQVMAEQQNFQAGSSMGTPVQPCCSLITSHKLFLFHEDSQTTFLRCLATCDIASITCLKHLKSESSFVLLEFLPSESETPWILYFFTYVEAEKFQVALCKAYFDSTQKVLPTENVEDTQIKRRAKNCLSAIKSSNSNRAPSS